MKETLFTGGRNHDVRRQVPAEDVLPSASERRNNRRMHRAGIHGGQDTAAGGYCVAQGKGGQHERNL